MARQDGLPQSVAAGFLAYLEAVFPGQSYAIDDRGDVAAVAGMSPTQLAETRRAFFAGALFMLTAVFEPALLDRPEEDVEAAVLGWRKELERYGREVGATATPEDEKAIADADAGIVYSRAECIFRYCDAPDVCRPADACRHARQS